MTTTETRVQVDDRTSIGDAETHYVCCLDDDAPGGVPSLCGQYVGGVDGSIDEVGCVVCADLSASDWCPNLGRCPYGETS